ncbi:MAG: hypothetical protein JWM80_3002 [Cyanobacteria bacterium RYN_339]|nr:hypothetical protein [Cyanobacteria bacterium RYN_339]
MKLAPCILLALLSGCAATPPATPSPQLIKAAMAFVQGAVVETQNPANLAIEGNGFFLVARKPTPATWDDLAFTRDGVFKFEFTPEATGARGVYRLVNKDGFYAFGYASPAIENVRPFGTPPEESQGTQLADLDVTATPDTLGGTPRHVPLKPIEVQLATNPDAPNALTFDNQGLLRVKGQAPHDADGKPANIYVALATVDERLGLRRMNGDFDAGMPYYLYQPAAGQIHAGVAGTGNGSDPRLVGASNVLTPGAAEQPVPVDAIADVFARLNNR